MSARFFFAALGRGRGSFVQVMARAESEDGSIIGDYRELVRKGEHFCGIPYATMRKRGGGQIQLDSEGHGFIVEAEA